MCVRVCVWARQPVRQGAVMPRCSSLGLWKGCKREQKASMQMWTPWLKVWILTTRGVKRDVVKKKKNPEREQTSVYCTSCTDITWLPHSCAINVWHALQKKKSHRPLCTERGPAIICTFNTWKYSTLMILHLLRGDREAKCRWPNPSVLSLVVLKDPRSHIISCFSLHESEKQSFLFSLLLLRLSRWVYFKIIITIKFSSSCL